MPNIRMNVISGTLVGLQILRGPLFIFMQNGKTRTKRIQIRQQIVYDLTKLGT